MPDTIIPDNWDTRTKRHKAHTAEIARLQAQLDAERKFREAFGAWLVEESPWFDIDTSDCIEDKYNELKAQYIDSDESE